MAFELPKPVDDGLYKDTVGPQSIDKHHFLRRYIDAFTTAMKDMPWSGLHYIDLFAGPGISIIDTTGDLEWGSPLIAAQAPNRFTGLHLCDMGKKKIEALQARIENYNQPTPPQLLLGDANQKVHDVTKSIPIKSLSLAFLDPYGLHLNFDTLASLSSVRADLIIFFPDHLDALRNWENVYQGRPDSNLDLVLGTDAWLKAFNETARDKWAEALHDIYIQQIKKLGYKYFEDERIALPNGRYLYKLIFCSAHPMGAKIWRGISKKKPDGQLGLFGD
jgi:three-Cys-motif partner protein